MRIDKDLVAAVATPLVLAILAEGPSYGYAILARVKELSGGELEWSDGMLYPLLHRLQSVGHLTAEWANSPEGRRRKYYAITVRPTVFINLVPDHVILHRMFPLAHDRTIVECDWLFSPDVVASGKDVQHSMELFHRVNEQDFEACERTQPAMSSRAYKNGGVLVPAEHHIGEFHEWTLAKLGDTGSKG